MTVEKGGEKTTVSLINVAVWSTIYIHIHIFLKSVLLLGNKSVSVCVDKCVSLFLHCFVKQFLVGYLPAVNMTPSSYLGGGVSSPMLRLLAIYFNPSDSRHMNKNRTHCQSYYCLNLFGENETVADVEECKVWV